jgi:diacylglycerol O-acyltransferase
MPTELSRWPGRMNPTDALFWFMDKIPEMRSTIGALVILERPPLPQRVREDFERISHAFVRMRQRVVEVPLALAPPEWIEDPQFDLDYHMRYMAVPAPGGIEDLLHAVSPLYATAFDPERPLWEAYVAEGLVGGQGAVFIKMHHCLTDGVGGTRLFADLLGNGREAPRAALPLPADTRSTLLPAVLWRAALYNAREAVALGIGVAGSIAAAALDLRATLAGARRGLWMVTGFGSEFIVPRAASPLHQQRSLSRCLSTFEMSLADLDAARAGLDATNNDIVLTIVSGAMHRWHTSRGADVQELRALVPVNLRSSDDMNAGNRLALLAVSLPVGQPNPVRRLRIIQQRMGRVKADRRATLYPWMARLVTAMPMAVAERIARQQTSRTNFVCTNVPGPQQACYLAGEEIKAAYAYAPLVGDHPVAIALYSYRGMVYVGLDIDPLAMDDLPHFQDALRESYEEVLNVARQAKAVRHRPAHRRHRPRSMRRAS